jgi:hypothetical protein
MEYTLDDPGPEFVSGRFGTPERSEEEKSRDRHRDENHPHRSNLYEATAYSIVEGEHEFMQENTDHLLIEFLRQASIE